MWSNLIPEVQNNTTRFFGQKELKKYMLKDLVIIAFDYFGNDILDNMVKL